MKEARAPRWKFLAARLFGKKIVGIDRQRWPHTVRVVGYQWRGVLYLTEERTT
jgi:hypothetical protein